MRPTPSVSFVTPTRTLVPVRQARAVLPALGRAASAPRGAALGETWRTLQRAALPAGRGGLSPAAAWRAVERASAQVAGLHDGLGALYAANPVAHAASALAQAPRRAKALLVAAAARTGLEPALQAQLLAALGAPTLRGPVLAAALRQRLPRAVALVILEAKLRELRAINAILRDWAEALAKWAAMEKAAHARADKQAEAFARTRLDALQQHFAALGVATRRQQTQSVGAAQALRLRHQDDALAAAAPAAGADDAWAQPMANVSLLSALSLPQASGVPTRGRPPRFALSR